MQLPIQNNACNNVGRFNHSQNGVNLWANLLDAVYQYLVHILSPVTDNCPSSISGRERIAVEDIL